MASGPGVIKKKVDPATVKQLICMDEYQNYPFNANLVFGINIRQYCGCDYITYGNSIYFDNATYPNYDTLMNGTNSCVLYGQLRDVDNFLGAGGEANVDQYALVSTTDFEMP
jgi:hypothetical protein